MTNNDYSLCDESVQALHEKMHYQHKESLE